MFFLSEKQYAHIENEKDVIEVPYSETSIYEDTEANPMVLPWRYKISATPKDSRYSETALSEAHRTLHLQKMQGLGSEVNLQWNAYEGVDYATYKIIRTAVVDSEIIVDTIATIASNINTYTDVSPIEGTQSYCVAILLPETIDANTLLKAEAGPFALAISNIAEAENDSGEGTAITTVNKENVRVRVIERTVCIDNAHEVVQVYDLTGRLIVQSKSADTNQQITISHAGVYFVKVGNALYKVILK